MTRGGCRNHPFGDLQLLATARGQYSSATVKPRLNRGYNFSQHPPESGRPPRPRSPSPEARRYVLALSQIRYASTQYQYHDQRSRECMGDHARARLTPPPPRSPAGTRSTRTRAPGRTAFPPRRGAPGDARRSSGGLAPRALPDGPSPRSRRRSPSPHHGSRNRHPRNAASAWRSRHRHAAGPAATPPCAPRARLATTATAGCRQANRQAWSNNAPACSTGNTHRESCSRRRNARSRYSRLAARRRVRVVLASELVRPGVTPQELTPGQWLDSAQLTRVCQLPRRSIPPRSAGRSGPTKTYPKRGLFTRMPRCRLA